MLVTLTNGDTGDVLDDPQLVDAGSSFTLSCSATGTPIANISWTMGGIMLTSDSTKILIVDSTATGVVVSNVTIMNFIVTDGGVYTCVANNSDGMVSMSSEIRLSKYFCRC